MTPRVVTRGGSRCDWRGDGLRTRWGTVTHRLWRPGLMEVRGSGAFGGTHSIVYGRRTVVPPRDSICDAAERLRFRVTVRVPWASITFPRLA